MSGFDLTGRVAIVTGASRGLGQTFARALARAGADLVVTSRTRASLEPFHRDVESLGRRIVSLELDVRSEESIRAMAAAAAKAYPRIDILVNNAGCNVRKPAADVTWEDWNLILDTNLRGAFFVAQAVARCASCAMPAPQRATSWSPAPSPTGRRHRSGEVPSAPCRRWRWPFSYCSRPFASPTPARRRRSPRSCAA